MANSSRTGFWPVGTLSGAPWTASVRKFATNASYATAIFLGDVVTSHTDGYIEAAAATDVPVGVVVGIEPVAKQSPSTGTFSVNGNTSPNLALKHRAASTSTYVYVVTDPKVILEAQDDGANVLARADGICFLKHIATAGNTTTGISGHVLDSTNKDEGNVLTFRMVEAKPQIDNDTSLVNAKFRVTFAKHQFGTDAGV